MEVTFALVIIMLTMTTVSTNLKCPCVCNCTQAIGKLYVECENETIPNNIPTDVTNLVLSNLIYPVFPLKIFSGMTKLKELKIIISNISHLHNDTFFGLLKLQVLRLRRIQLQSIGIRLFKPLISIKTIEISNNAVLKLKAILQSSYGLRSSPIEEIIVFCNEVNPMKRNVLVPEDFFNLQYTKVKKIDIHSSRICMNKGTFNSYLPTTISVVLFLVYMNLYLLG